MKFKQILSIAVSIVMMCGAAFSNAAPMPMVAAAEQDGGIMNETVEATDFSFGGSWGEIPIPAKYFLKDAEEIRITVKGAQYVGIKIEGQSTFIKEYQNWSTSDPAQLVFSYVLSAEAREAALAGKLLGRGSTSSAILSVTNLDREGLEAEQSGGGGSSLYPQITDVPTVYIEFETNGKSIYEILYKDKTTNIAPYVTATIRVVDNSDPDSPQHLESFVDQVQMKVRGNSTADGAKRPYRLKFAKDEKDAEGNVTVQHKHDLLGLGYKKRNWTMLALALDPSLMRNALTYHIGQYVGMPFCPGYKFVDLVINNEYQGTYQISDHCEVGSNRVEVDGDTGWFIEATRDYMAEDPKVSSNNLWMTIKNPEPDDEATLNQLKTDVKNYFDAFQAQIKNTDPQTGWRAYADEETLVNYYIGANITGDYDGFMQLKMYREAENDKLHFGPLWDKDLAFGNFTADNGKKMMQDMDNGQFYNLLKDLWKDPYFVKNVHDRYHEILNNGLAANLAQDIQNIKALVSQTQVENLKKHSTSLSSWNLRFNTYDEAVTQLADYVKNHINFLTETIDAQFVELNCGSLPSDKHQQLTNLPTIYLTATVGDEWSAAEMELFDKDNKLKRGAEWSTKALEVQYQGSGDKNKDSYRLRFGSKTDLLPSGSFKQWVLLANDDDPSLMRNALAKKMGDALGLPFTPGYEFVDLYLNDVYMGTYQVTDRIKVEAGRAMVTGGNKDNDWHVRLNDETEYKEDLPTYFIEETSARPYLIPKNPDPKDDPSLWNSTLKDEMTTYFNNLFGKTDGHYTTFAEQVDKQQLIRWYIAQEVLCVYKGFSSIETYRSVTATDQKLHMGVLWDSEKSLGNVGLAPAIDMSDKDTKGSYKGMMTNYAAYGMMSQLFADLWTQPWFANGVKALWDEKSASLKTTMKATVTELSATLAQSQAQNAKKWAGSLGSYASYNDATSAIGTWFDTRFAYLDAKFAALADALPCEHHTYEGGEYAKADDSTYRRVCDKCGVMEDGAEAEVYYLYKVYEEAKTPKLTYTTDKEWPLTVDTSKKPNTLFVTETPGIHGHNVVSAGYCDELVITDGHPFYYKEKVSFKAAKASYTRQVKADTNWGTVCLPFKLEDNDDVTLFALASVNVDGEEGMMYFDHATKTGASTPLVFRKNQIGATSITFTGALKNGYVTVKETDGLTSNTSEEIADGWNFYGNLYESKTKTFANDPGMYFISGDKFWHATGTLTIDAFRAYFSATAAPQAARFRIGTADTDGIEAITADEADTQVSYDMMGRSAGRQGSLTPGIYVINGKKTLIKK